MLDQITITKVHFAFSKRVSVFDKELTKGDIGLLSQINILHCVIIEVLLVIRNLWSRYLGHTIDNYLTVAAISQTVTFSPVFSTMTFTN